MKATLFLALKDVLKDKKILLMIIFMIGIGVTASLTMTGLFNGFQDYFNDVTINVMTGHLAIFPKEDEEYVTNIRNIERKVELLPEVKGVSPRLLVNGIAIRENKESQVRITGLTPSKEIKTTKIADKVTSGEFLSDNDKDVLLGSVLADNLKVKTGEKIRITFRNGVVNEYKVKGFLDTGSRSGDEVAVYTTNKELEDVLGIKDSASQIIIKLTDIDLVDKSKTNILQLGINGEIKTWKELSTYLEAITKNFNIIFGIINFVSLTAAAVSIAVVMFINVEQKTREIGILKAIGARNSFVMKVFLTEVLLYAFFGVLLGNILGRLVLTYLPVSSAFRIGNMVIAIIPIVTLTDIVKSSVTVFLVTFVAGIYPVIIATRMDMIKAIWKG
jgi:putative ABC transport system permease protein